MLSRPVAAIYGGGERERGEERGRREGWRKPFLLTSPLLRLLLSRRPSYRGLGAKGNESQRSSKLVGEIPSSARFLLCYSCVFIMLSAAGRSGIVPNIMVLAVIYYWYGSGLFARVAHGRNVHFLVTYWRNETVA